MNKQGREYGRDNALALTYMANGNTLPYSLSRENASHIHIDIKR